MVPDGLDPVAEDGGVGGGDAEDEDEEVFEAHVRLFASLRFLQAAASAFIPGRVLSLSRQ